MKGKKVFVIVIWLLFWCRGLFAFTSGIPATSTIKNVYITGTGPTEDSQFYNWQVSSLTWNGSFWEGTVNLVPGNTYYYKYIIEYETRGTTETVWEQKDELRSIYISPDDRVFLDGDFENSYTVSEIFDNWAGSPPPPQISNIDVNSGQAVVYIKKPTFGNREIIDLKGYLIYLSTDKVNWINYNDTSTLVSSNRTQIELKGLQNNTTYFLKIRSVDRYDYGVIDINSPYYPDSTLKRKYPWLYSEVVSFRPDRRVFCEFSLEYFGNETVFLNINGKKIKMKKKGEKYIASVKLINNESYSYQYETQNLTDPQGERNIKISDIDGDGKFYIDDVWGVGISFEVPFEIIGWQVSSSTGEISFSWKKNPQHEGEITIFYSSDKYNWNVLVTTSSQNYTWKNFMTGATYYFSIGSFKNQSSPCQVLAGSTSFFKNPPPLKITKIFEGIEASDFRDSLKILSSPKNFDKKFSDFLIFYSTYNIEISTGTNFDWQIYDFLSKKKGFSPNSPMIYANLPSTTPLKAFYIRGAGFLEDNSGVYCTQPDVFVTPALIEYKKQKTFSRDKVSVSFGKYSLPVKKAYLTFYKYEEIEVSQKFKQIREKITQAIENSLKISFQSFISTDTVFLFSLKKTDGKKITSSFKEDVSLTIPYPLWAEPENILPFYLDEENGFFRIVKTQPEVPKPKINYSSATITFKTDHFSVFALMYAFGERDLSDVKVYPNPYKPYDGRWETGHKSGDWAGIHFRKLTANTRIRIYTIDGIPVRDNLYSDTQGYCWWDAKNDKGQELSSGLYIFVAEDEKAMGRKKFIGKIAIIR